MDFNLPHFSCLYVPFACSWNLLWKFMFLREWSVCKLDFVLLTLWKNSRVVYTIINEISPMRFSNEWVKKSVQLEKYINEIDIRPLLNKEELQILIFIDINKYLSFLWRYFKGIMNNFYLLSYDIFNKIPFYLNKLNCSNMEYILYHSRFHHSYSYTLFSGSMTLGT